MGVHSALSTVVLVLQQEALLMKETRFSVLKDLTFAGLADQLIAVQVFSLTRILVLNALKIVKNAQIKYA